MSAPVPIPAGALLTVTSGEYSNYSVRGIFRALREIDVLAMRDKYLALHPEQAARNEFEDDQFLAFLASEDLLEPVDAWEIYLGDYGNVDMLSAKHHE